MIKQYVFLALCCLFVTTADAQVDVRLESQVSVASGDHTPLWLNANKYGLSSLDCTNGYVRAGAFRSIDVDSARQWAWGLGADVAVAAGYTSTFIVQQAYGELRWLKGLLTVGSKEQPMVLKDHELSSGSQTFGINARPVPGIRLSLPDYWNIPGTKGWLGIKGHFFYGMQTDDGWQKDFTDGKSKFTEHTKLHTKAGYLRVGREDRPFNVEMGLEMACQFGGTSYPYGYAKPSVKNSDGIKAMMHALVPGGAEAIDGPYENSEGNHLGSWLLRANLDYEGWGASVYADHFFEDHSSMFLLDYDGYGSGSEWNVKKESRYFRYDLKDIMLGAEVRLRHCDWLNKIVVEYLYTKYQCGPIYHDHSQRMSDHVSGIDNYYNHVLLPGWQHWGQVMGNPLYRSPLYNDDHELTVEDNRFWAWHFGFAGDPLKNLHYRVLASIQRGWGTYERPLLDPQRNLSLLAEASYRLPAGWSVKGAFGLDSGKLLGNNVGFQLTVAKCLRLENR